MYLAEPLLVSAVCTATETKWMLIVYAVARKHSEAWDPTRTVEGNEAIPAVLSKTADTGEKDECEGLWDNSNLHPPHCPPRVTASRESHQDNS